MSLYFITWNINKFNEAKAIIPELEQLKIDLPEIQDIDAKAIIEAKINEALKHKKWWWFVIEDISLYLDCLNWLPWPLIKRFLKKIWNEWLYQIAKNFNNYNVEAKCIVWYANYQNKIQFFEWIIKWSIVSPRWSDKFGFDMIFQPEWYEKTFSQMLVEEKNLISMRKLAFEKLKKVI